jgi:hypothetical protein
MPGDNLTINVALLPNRNERWFTFLLSVVEQ